MDKPGWLDGALYTPAATGGRITLIDTKYLMGQMSKPCVRSNEQTELME